MLIGREVFEVRISDAVGRVHTVVGCIGQLRTELIIAKVILGFLGKIKV